ncbi:hypothetical protein Bpfe_005422 [Biomphalaria pfeifferi]|uniref:Uncharacterized protein n=1 Tax=Biomphalaria pfeifferi TaxID=112525 RepID=A0AAD8C2M4_BIOPF|nr:hypothetical protein Bpfe_005422 [Biomphalaria pfeifferi]
MSPLLQSIKTGKYHHCSKVSSWKCHHCSKKSQKIHNCFKMLPLIQDVILENFTTTPRCHSKNVINAHKITKYSQLLQSVITAPRCHPEKFHHCGKISQQELLSLLQDVILENVTTGKCYHCYNMCWKMSHFSKILPLENVTTAPRCHSGKCHHCSRRSDGKCHFSKNHRWKMSPVLLNINTGKCHHFSKNHRWKMSPVLQNISKRKCHHCSEM